MTPTVVDLETGLIRPGLLLPPPAICTSYHPQDGARLWHTDEIPAFFERALQGTVVGHDIGRFDMAVIAEWYPQLRPAIWKAFEEDRILDTLMAQRIVQIQRGEPGPLALCDCCRRYGIQTQDKGEGTEAQRLRLSFGQFIGAKKISPDHARYALQDAVDPFALFERQMSTNLVTIKDLALLTRQSFWTGIGAARGFRTDAERVQIFKQRVEEHLDLLDELAREAGFVRPNGVTDTKVVKCAVAEAYCPGALQRFGITSPDQLSKAREADFVAWCRNEGLPLPLSESKKSIGTDKIVKADSGSPELEDLETWGQWKAAYSKDVDILLRGTVEPVHTRFSLANTLRVISSEPNCYDAETEILTEAGWRRFDELQRGLAVAAWRDGEIEFQQPTAYYEGEGELLHISTEQHVDLCVTPNHRCLFANRKTGAVYEAPAREFRKDALHLHAGHYRGDGLSLSPEAVILLCATQADGSYVGTHGVKFAFSRTRKIDRLEAAMLKLGVRFSKTGPDSKGVTSFYIQQTCKWNAWLRATMPAKTFGYWLLGLDSGTQRLVLDEVAHWDSHAASAKRFLYASQHKINADVVQALACLHGRRARTVCVTFDDARAPSWQVSVLNRNSSATTNATVQQLPAAKVYCVTVPSGFVVVRRNGVTSISGNSNNFGKGKRPSPVEDKRKLRLRYPDLAEAKLEQLAIARQKVWGVRECISPRPGNAIVTTDIKGLENGSLAQCIVWALGDRRFAEKVNSGRDIHAELGSDILGTTYEDIQARRAAGDIEAEEARDCGKPGNFGLSGGMRRWQTLQGYARRGYNVRMTEERTKAVIAAFDRYAEQDGRAQWLRRANLFKNSEGRYDVQLPLTSIWRRSVSRTDCCNNPFQTLGALIATEAGWQITRAQYLTGACPGNLIFFVYDDFTTECPSDVVDEVAAFHEKAIEEAGQKISPDVIYKGDSRALTHLSKGTKAKRDANGRLTVAEVKV